MSVCVLIQSPRQSCTLLPNPEFQKSHLFCVCTCFSVDILEAFGGFVYTECVQMVVCHTKSDNQSTVHIRKVLTKIIKNISIRLASGHFVLRV